MALRLTTFVFLVLLGALLPTPVEAAETELRLGDPVCLHPKGNSDCCGIVSQIEKRRVYLADLEGRCPRSLKEGRGWEISAVRIKSANSAQKKFWLNQFQFGAVGVLQAQGGSVLSAMASWNPTLSLGQQLFLRGSFDVTLLKNIGAKFFPALGYAALLSFARDSLFVEGGLGAQTWLGNGGTRAVILANLGWLQPDPSLPIDRLFAGYSVILDSIQTHLFRVGIGLRL